MDVSQGGLESIIRLAKHVSTGNYVVGNCTCNMTFVDAAVDEFIHDLGDMFNVISAIAEVGCQIMWETFDDVLTVASLAIPGEGEIAAARAGLSMSLSLSRCWICSHYKAYYADIWNRDSCKDCSVARGQGRSSDGLPRSYERITLWSKRQSFTEWRVH